MTVRSILYTFLYLILFLPINSYAIDFKDIGAGGGGQVYEFYVNGNTLIAGSDVGGIFLSTDGGKSFKNISKGLTSVKINTLDVTGNTIYLGTSNGVFKSTDKGNTWVQKNTGLEAGDESFTHPIQAIRIDPSNSKTLWLAIGQPNNSSFRDTDPYSFYKSTDGAETWSPVLNISMASVDSNLGSLMAQIKIHPSDSNKVWFLTSQGFYYTEDGGSSFYELGIKKAKITKNKGGDWDTCGASNTNCSSEFRTSTKLCTEGTDCLPITTSIGETHPNVSDMDVYVDPSDESKVTLYATIRDNGYYSSSTCIADRYNDVSRLVYKGGVYTSTDWGKTWTSKNSADDGSQLPSYIRCGKLTDIEFTSNIYGLIRVNPDDPDHFIVGSQEYRGGIYEYRKQSDGETSWVYWSDDSVCGEDQACYEGQSSQGLWASQKGPSTNFMVVSSWSENKPVVYLSHSRGLTKATNNYTQDSVTFDLIDSDYNSSDLTWESNGLSDYCARDMAFIDDQLLVVGSDSNAIIGAPTDEGYVWKMGTYSLDGDESGVVVYDEEGGKVFTNNFQSSSSSQNSVLQSSDDGETWNYIGGDCGQTICSTDYGLANDNRVYSMAIDYSSSKTKRKIWAGTAEGLYLYDPSTSGDTKWSLVEGEGCPTHKSAISSILTFPDQTKYALIAANSPIGITIEDGVYLLKKTSTSVSCTLLSGGESIAEPNTLAITQLEDGSYSLLVTAAKSGRSTVLLSPFLFTDTSVINWDTVLSHTLAQSMSGLSETDNFKKKDFSRIAVDPAHPNIILIGMLEDPSFDDYVPQHIYYSKDYGQTFDIYDDLEDFPIKNIDVLRFDPDGKKLYIGPRCGSLYAMDNPFTETTGGGSTSGSETSGGSDSGGVTGDENVPPQASGCSLSSSL